MTVPNPTLIPPTSGVINRTAGAPTTAPPSLVPPVGATAAGPSSFNPPAPAPQPSPAPATPPGTIPTPAVPATPAPNPTPNPVTATPTPAVPGTSSSTSSSKDPTSISGQLDDLLESGSPYLELAKTQSEEQSASRGLQNSSIAAGAGEAAAIAAAAPIATQQAQMAQQAKLQKESEDAQINNIVTQGTVQEKLNAQQDAFQKLINDINNGQQITLANVNFQNQMKLTAAQGGIDLQKIQAQTKGTIDQINAQAAATASGYGPALQSQYLQGVSQIMAANTQAITQIYATQGLTSAQQQAAVATQNLAMQQQLKNLAAFYASSPLWLTGQNPAPIPGANKAGSSLIPATTTPNPVTPNPNPATTTPGGTDTGATQDHGGRR